MNTHFRRQPEESHQSHVSKSSTMPVGGGAGLNSLRARAHQSNHRNEGMVTAEANFDDFDGGSLQMMEDQEAVDLD